MIHPPPQSLPWFLTTPTPTPFSPSVHGCDGSYWLINTEKIWAIQVSLHFPWKNWQNSLYSNGCHIQFPWTYWERAIQWGCRENRANLARFWLVTSFCMSLRCAALFSLALYQYNLCSSAFSFASALGTCDTALFINLNPLSYTSSFSTYLSFSSSIIKLFGMKDAIQNNFHCMKVLIQGPALVPTPTNSHLALTCKVIASSRVSTVYIAHRAHDSSLMIILKLMW